MKTAIEVQALLDEGIPILTRYVDEAMVRDVTEFIQERSAGACQTNFSMPALVVVMHRSIGDHPIVYWTRISADQAAVALRLHVPLLQRLLVHTLHWLLCTRFRS